MTIKIEDKFLSRLTKNEEGYIGSVIQAKGEEQRILIEFPNDEVISLHVEEKDVYSNLRKVGTKLTFNEEGILINHEKIQTKTEKKSSSRGGSTHMRDYVI